MQLASRFSRNLSVIRGDAPLSFDAIRAVAPSVFADEKHDSRSDRYTYIPTSQILEGLRKEGFEPFYAAQTRTRDEGNKEHTKHLLRLRHASQISAKEANEIVLLNSHNGSSSYQMLSGVYRFVCANGLVCGDTFEDIRVPHKGDILGRVIEGAYQVLDTFEQVNEHMAEMKAITLNHEEAESMAGVALALKYDDPIKPAPITESQLLRPRRAADAGTDLWTLFNVTQENLVRGGLSGRAATGKRTTTREVGGVTQSVKLNQALWKLAEAIRKAKA